MTVPALTLAIAAAAMLAQVRTDTAAAQELARAEAQQELSRDLRVLRAQLATPAHEAQQDAGALRVLLARTITGTGDADTVLAARQRIATLRRTAEQLEAAAEHPHPTRPSALSVASVDRLFDLLDPLAEQARDVAAELTAAADTAERLLEPAAALTSAARALTEHTGSLPTSGDPEILAAAWQTERELARDHLDAAAGAAAEPELARLASAHRAIATRVHELAEEALELLGDGDVDGYNALLEAELGRTNGEVVATTLAHATTASVAQAVRDVETARARTLGLLTELERVRRATPATVAAA